MERSTCAIKEPSNPPLKVWRYHSLSFCCSLSLSVSDVQSSRAQMNAPHVVSITDPATGGTARSLVSLGFNCFSWRPVLQDGTREMLWAHPDFASGNESPSGSGVPLLFPFPGRIGKARFMFSGREYSLEPGDRFGNAIHGFVYNRPWRAVEQSVNRV